MCSNFIRKNKLILLIFALVLIRIDVFAQGLQFHSNIDLIEARTSYNVFAEKSVTLKDFLEIKFDLSVNSPNSFGSVLHVKNKENNHHYNLVHTNENDNISYLKFSIDSKEIPISVLLLKKELGKRKWINISIIFDAQKDSIYFNIDDRKYSIYNEFSTNKFSPSVFFGKYDSFIDVPDISIRKLRISGKKTSVSFNFNEISGSQVHDSKGFVWGSVENPIWLINESFFWKSRFRFSSDKVTATNFDSKLQRFIFINSDSICFFDIVKDTFLGNKLPEKTPVPLRLGLSFISEEGEELTVYELNDVSSNKPTIASINLSTLNWEIWSNEQFDKQSHHHISNFTPEKEEYIIFGGFGNKEYFNEFYSIKKGDSNWEKLHFKGDTISPRFFSGGTKLSNDELIIFGGVGNPSRQQSAGKIYYTDCYLVNLQDKVIKKLWNSDALTTKMVSGTNLILSTDSLYFYSIYYPEYLPHTFLKLYKFSIKDGTYEIVGDSIPMISERIRTNAKLYFNRVLNELYCVTQEFQLDGSSEIEIYSISSPPVAANNYYREVSKHKDLGFINLIIIALGGLILFLFWRRYIRRKKLNIQKSLIISNKNIPDTFTNQLKNSVYLFGEFKVFDKRGKEISYLFSPKIQQLFLIILLNSKKNKITSREIYSVLWPEKPLEKAKNSKGVVLNQLRKIISDIEGIELHTENRKLYFKTENNFYCDYIEFSTNINILKSNDTIPENTPESLFAILSAGQFLKFVELEYFDSIKKDFENEVISLIPFQLDKYFKKENYLMVLQLCKIMFYIDLTNELAFHYEIVAYTKLNMLEKARKRFNAFSFEYKKESNDDYNYTFSDLTNHKSYEFIRQNSIY